MIGDTCLIRDACYVLILISVGIKELRSKLRVVRIEMSRFCLLNIVVRIEYLVGSCCVRVHCFST